MEKIRKVILCAALFIVANCIMPTVVHAQGFDDDVDEGVSDMPLDGNITMMAAGGFAYIVKKVSDRRRKDK